MKFLRLAFDSIKCLSYQLKVAFESLYKFENFYTSNNILLQTSFVNIQTQVKLCKFRS